MATRRMGPFVVHYGENVTPQKQQEAPKAPRAQRTAGQREVGGNARASQVSAEKGFGLKKWERDRRQFKVAGLKAIQGIWPPNDGPFMGNMTQARADSIEGVPRDGECSQERQREQPTAGVTANDGKTGARRLWASDVPETSTSVLVNSETTTTATATNSLATHNYQAGCISHLRLASRPTNIPTSTQARMHARRRARVQAQSNSFILSVGKVAGRTQRDASSAGQDAEDEFGGLGAAVLNVATNKRGGKMKGRSVGVAEVCFAASLFHAGWRGRSLGQNLDERKAEEINQSAEIAARIRSEVAFEVGVEVEVEVEVDEVKVGHAVR
ncbi:hypothetical protein CPLU01_02875 [Colletotrichum plurivorum]|uniref:Uncharacterized protein n=1 Tax=Colletotrichum plurivorum TaxID=2175906 RepID=A0A8H6NME3_9PEZI|nr:hypothetical protein CPLU01_02875 [Colletotrichum plurivorum]